MQVREDGALPYKASYSEGRETARMTARGRAHTVYTKGYRINPVAFFFCLKLLS